MVEQTMYLWVIISCVLFKVYGHESQISKDVEKRILVGSFDVQNEITKLKATVQEMQFKLSQQESQLKSYERKLDEQGKGGIYTCWGRKYCPTDNATELVYSGFAGGSRFSHTGAAAEYVCLPPDPILSTVDISKTIPSYEHRYPAYMYGSEYESNFFGSHTHTG